MVGQWTQEPHIPGWEAGMVERQRIFSGGVTSGALPVSKHTLLAGGGCRSETEMNYVDTAELRDGHLGGNNDNGKNLNGIRTLKVLGRS